MTDVATKVVWEEPPARTVRSKWRELVEQLKERPGEWAKIATGKKSTMYTAAGNLNSGRIGLPDGKYEFTSRGIDAEMGAVYGRYLEG